MPRASAGSLSVVVPVFNEEESLRPLHREISEALQNRFAAADQGCQAADGFSVSLVIRDRFGQNHSEQKCKVGVLRFIIR